eukprot:CAMPEP_0197827556 /NCGR_PEP_ID=MMETSP1437-20131217/4296_1 /TAXON_ID=49252 ORGANISM="Eucampia antarctica, Strain CCMP1452" /NCGR_SAMPLE_ID=MMETSP1437 /ASSEMBLY_ACC=CAM_ASM_001096 /LENGTH=266 /DNA_ID=CAMNT_0043428427 /DNA_START=36 /DNA_END=836 /DNA_ORIENTATION=-
MDEMEVVWKEEEERLLASSLLEPCGKSSSGDQEYCQHGSKCFITNDGTNAGFECDCNINYSMSIGAYAGPLCQYKATFYCMINANTGFPLVNDKSFCTNDGSCRQIITTAEDPHSGCRCPDEFEGMYCEFAIADRPRKSALARLAGFVMSMFAIGIVLLVCFMIYRYYKQRQLERSLAFTASCATAELQFDVTYSDDAQLIKNNNNNSTHSSSSPSISHGNEEQNALTENNNTAHDDDGGGTIEITTKKDDGKFYGSPQMKDMEMT